ncbi:MAG: alpha-galactosidase, partial [Mogibacterium sp.]|nr:alpha-galactosidase [Mogibacterium sp.]
MSILFNEENRTITIHTLNTSYQMRIDEHGFLQHTYYGGRVREEDLSYLHLNYDRACAGNPDDAFPSRRISFDTMPQEFPGYGVGDYRINALAVRNADGSYGADFRYVSHEITKGKYSIEGLPSSYDSDGSAETLIVTVADKVTGLTLQLLYGVFEKTDVITRAVRIINGGSSEITLDRAFSMSLDIPFGRWDLIHFSGKHALERQTEREKLTHLVKSVESRRGTSSHQENPFVIIADRRADEDHGACYGMMLVYSGGFRAQAEVDQFDSTRVIMGIQDDQFDWPLRPGESFSTP